MGVPLFFSALVFLPERKRGLIFGALLFADFFELPDVFFRFCYGVFLSFQLGSGVSKYVFQCTHIVAPFMRVRALRVRADISILFVVCICIQHKRSVLDVCLGIVYTGPRQRV